MTKLEELARQAFDSLGVVLGFFHPEIASTYTVGWTKDLPAIDAAPFKGKPRKPRKVRRAA